MYNQLISLKNAFLEIRDDEICERVNRTISMFSRRDRPYRPRTRMGEIVNIRTAGARKVDVSTEILEFPIRVSVGMYI